MVLFYQFNCQLAIMVYHLAYFFLKLKFEDYFYFLIIRSQHWSLIQSILSLSPQYDQFLFFNQTFRFFKLFYYHFDYDGFHYFQIQFHFFFRYFYDHLLYLLNHVFKFFHDFIFQYVNHFCAILNLHHYFHDFLSRYDFLFHLDFHDIIPRCFFNTHAFHLLLNYFLILDYFL